MTSPPTATRDRSNRQHFLHLQNRTGRRTPSQQKLRVMGESQVITEELLGLCLQRITIEENARNVELEFIEVLRNVESIRKRWLHAETELKKYKELLVKSDVAKAGLEVKLKHARNQLDVEMRKRYKMEGDFQYLQRQMQLMCDILVHDTKSSACLNEEQKSLLATFEHKGANKTLHRCSKRLSAIDESSFFSHSDISYDRTDDDLDLDTSLLKPLRSRARERRRSSMGLTVALPAEKRGRNGNISAEPPGQKNVEKEVETTVKALVTTPDTGVQVHVEVGIPPETPEEIAQESAASDSPRDQNSLWFPCDPGEAQVQTEEKCRKHVFLSKTVIRPEMCLPCGKRIRFGRAALKCRNCRMVSHTECKQRCAETCVPGAAAANAEQVSLEDFAPATHPRIPPLIVACVKEIERRGLQERGLYRVPGGERQVKELRDRFLGGKKPQFQLSNVSDVHVVCGFLKDFLRKLKEPLVTFKLHRNFMAASEMSDDQKSTATVIRTVAELPKPHRDTLAFLMLHFHKVMQSPKCQMDQNNLSRVLGPTLVGHGLTEPSPSTIMRDTTTQPKVVFRFLSLPEDYWRHVLSAQGSNQGQGREAHFFDPLTSPELSGRQGAPGRASVRSRAKNVGNGYAEPGRRFFTSPS
ncbi:rac GTPase-activating protein 1 isoform X2 [Syngnathoides biaculeatus]|uniref:rac GTPase-activating protein 1 isoform X2 n=1 Tax=Syngnathoides biaculeatus TaxID=300417 RepID=UPI002ADE8029|nr:rac GTPase-activating protein 1 isoform X2 [Syngnathoides biaculeatus]